MNIISKLKTLPLVGALAIGLALSPASAMAEKGDRSYSNKGDRSNNSTFRADRRGDKHGVRSDTRHKDRKHGARNDNRKFAKKHALNHYKSKGQKHRSKHVYNSRGHGHNIVRPYNYNHSYGHNHGYRGHSHGLDNIEFMFGLHTGNFDIIFRD